MGISQSQPNTSTSSYNTDYYHTNITYESDNDSEENNLPVEKIRIIQSVIRGYLARLDLKKKDVSASKLQALIKKHQANLNVKSRIQINTVIEKTILGYQERYKCKRKKDSVKIIESFLKGLNVRNKMNSNEIISNYNTGIRGIYERKQYHVDKNNLTNYFYFWKTYVKKDHMKELLRLLQTKQNKTQLLLELEKHLSQKNLVELQNYVLNDKYDVDYGNVLSNLIQTKLNKTNMLKELDDVIKECCNEDDVSLESIKYVSNSWNINEHKRVIKGNIEESVCMGDENIIDTKKMYDYWNIYKNNKLIVRKIFDEWCNQVNWNSTSKNNIINKIIDGFYIWKHQEIKNRRYRRQTILQLQLSNTIYIYNYLFHYFNKWKLLSSLR